MLWYGSVALVVWKKAAKEYSTVEKRSVAFNDFGVGITTEKSEGFSV